MSTTDTEVIVAHNPPRRRKNSKSPPPFMSDLRIVLLGSSLSENSQVGNFILGRAVFDSEAPPDVVERVAGRLKDRQVIVINSSQLLQTNISDDQITQTLRECVKLSDPGPHVIVLLLEHDQCSAEDQERVEKVLLSFSESVYQHTIVITTQEPTETSDILQKTIQRCADRHFSLQRSSSPDDLLQMFEDIEKMNDGRHLDCAEALKHFTVEQQNTERQSVKLNLVVCGSDEALKSSISDLIQQQMDRRSDEELHGRLINVLKLPALIHLSEEEVMLQTLRCVSLCHPGVHVFLLVIPDAPLNNEVKAEIQDIQRIFSSRVNRHIMILIKQSSEHQTEELSEETQAVCKSFGGRHHYFGPKTQVSRLMKNIEQMLEENRGGCFSTETFLEAQIKKLIKYDEMKKKTDSIETHVLSQGSTESEEDLRIVLLGKTGVGKSAAGNTILGREAFTAETSHESVTKESQRQTSEIDSRRVTVIDTPGLFDTELSNEEIQREIRHCISMILPGPHVFIIVLSLGQRFTQEEAASVKIIQETFGENSLMYTMVLFTRGDELKNKTIEQFLEKPGSPLMKLIEACGNRYHVFNNNQTGDRTQVSDLLEKIDNMVKANGGSFYSGKMFRQMETEEQEQQMKILKEKIREKEEDMKREREEWEKQKQEEKTRREEEDEKRKEKEQRDCDEFNHRLKEERERMEKEKEDLQFKHKEEENRTKLLMKKHEEEKERMRMMMEEEQQNQDKERKRREEELREREERYKREIKEQEEQMKRVKEELKNEIKEMRKETETLKKEKENLQIRHNTEIDRLLNRIENERKNHETERKKREEELSEREERYKREMKEQEQIRDEMRREQGMIKDEMRQEKDIMKKEKENLQIEIDRLMNRIEDERKHETEKKRREEEFKEREERYKTLIKEKEESEEKTCEKMKKEREEWEKQKQEEETRREENEKEKQISDEQIHRLQNEMEEIIREKKKIERERREQLEDSEKRLEEERNTREEQQKTLEEKLKLLEEQHEEELKRRRVEWREEYEREKEKICSETDLSLQVNVQRNMERTGSLSLHHLFDRLHLDIRHFEKLRAADVLQINKQSLQSHESCAEEELVQTYIQKLLMMNYRARYITTKEINKHDHIQQTDKDLSEEEGDSFDVFRNISLSDKASNQSDLIHPMDLQMAVFHCADVFLKQLMVTKLSQCQYALPLLVPDPFTRQIEFPLWTFRQINKSWKMRNTENKIISQTQPIYKAQTPMVSFFRFGSLSSSKSQLMNDLINEKHNTFFHRNCPGSSRIRELMDGVVEIAWFCPSGTNTDKFNDCVAFCNLHGDAGDHEKQLQILTEMSSVNVVLLAKLDRNDRHAAKIQNLYKDRKPLICILTEDYSYITETLKSKYKIGLKGRNQSDVSEEIRRVINNSLSQSSSTFTLQNVSTCLGIRVDEEEDDECRRGREAAQKMMRLLKKKDLTNIQKSFLPHQGKLWHQWSQKNKELHRLRGENIEMEISRKKTGMNKIREQQHKLDISEFLELFINEMKTDDKHEMAFFLKCLGILLDEYISADLSALHHNYNEKWSTVVKLKENHDKPEQLKAEQTELERISDELQASSFGFEHIMREIGQIYESCSSVKENKKDLQVHFSSLPSLAAEMMISGFPLELMDGDAAHVPLVWISAVLDQLIQKLGDQTRVFVLSVLGLQSSGKSTMLNAMFGLQFAVSAGRCTRGAFMQLVRVSDEMKTQMNVDYILVVDTEGLHAPELAGRSTRHHDNELAAFVVGLGNLTLINILGENPAEMQDILQIVVQAFMRMKEVRLNPSCVFVHQNVSDVTAGKKNMEGKRRLQEKLDEMTKLAAEDEGCDAECFNDVIRFDVQNDVKYFAQLWEGNPIMAPPNPDYCENIQELKTTIMSHASNSHGMMLTHLKARIKDLWEALLNERFVFSFRNSLEISAYRKLETEYWKWSWSLRRAMMETENKLHNRIENEVIHETEKTDLQKELNNTSEEVEKTMSEFFEKDRDKDILIQWKASFEIKIKELQENIVIETKRRLNGVLEQQDLKKKIDAQRTNHENTLYEKSKELALKLKDKTNDEKTLKKEFDLFWDQSVNIIIRDTPANRDIDIMRDMREIIRDIYKSALVDHWKESRDIFTVSSFSDYVKLKKSSNFVTNFYKSAKDKFGYATDDAIQIKTFVTDVFIQTDKMIKLFNISKMGYNKSYIQQLIDYIRSGVTEHEKKQVRYVFKNQFFIDLVYSICKRENKMITDQHRLFRDANDPVIYAEKKREEYYSIFQKYCDGSASAGIFGQIICQKLKESIEQSVYKKTARDLTDEMRSNCESLKGNRSNLEKHILKTLVEEEDFEKYMNYILNPRDHFKSFIRDEVSRYITDQFSVSVLPKMKENIKLLEQKIMKAAHQSTEHVQENRGDAGLWLKSFTQQLSDELIFSEKDLSGIKHDDVDDFNLLKDVIRKELPVIMSEISMRFKKKSFDEKLDYKFKPDEILIDYLCQCCWVQCPFCTAICTNTLENHTGEHSVHFHRVDGLKGWHYYETEHLSSDICTTLVSSEKRFRSSDKWYSYKDYKSAGGVYATWSITPDTSELPYWKWIVCRFQEDLEKHYKKKFQGNGEIPAEWRNHTKQDAILSLEQN